LKQNGVTDFRKYFNDYPEKVQDSIAMVKIVDINKAVLELYEANSKEDLLQSLQSIFTKKSNSVFKEEFITIAEGRTRFEFESVNKTLNGNEKFIHLKWSVVPGSEETLERVYVSTADITKRKKAEEELKLFKKALETSTDAFGMSTFEGKHYFQNKAFSELFGDIGNDPPASIYVDEKEGRKVFETIMGGDSWVNDIKMYGKGKKVLDIYLRAFPTKDENGNIINLVGVHTDITTRKQAEKALRESEERFSRLSNLTYEGIVIHKDEIVIDANSSFIKMCGYKREEIIGKNIIQMIIPTKYHEALYASMQNEVVLPYIIESIRKDGTLLPLEIESRAIEYGIDNQNVRVVALRDVSIRKKSEQEIQKLLNAIEQTPVSILITNIDGNIEYVNPKFTEVTGYSFNEVVGQNPSVLKSGEQAEGYYENMWDTITSGNVWTGEFLNKKKNGELFWESASISPIKDKAGIVTHFVAVKEDITESKLAKEVLIESEERYRITTDATGDVYYQLSYEKMKYIYLHPNVEKLTGFKKDEFNLRSIMLEIQDRGKVIKSEDIRAHRKTASTEVYNYEYLIKTKSGKEKWISDRSYPLFDKDGILIGSYGVLSDITKKKKMLNEIIESKEMAENADKMKDIFLAQMSHEIRTPINAIVGMSSLLKYDFEELIDEDQLANFDIIERAGNRIIRTVDLLLNLSEIQANTYKPDITEFDIVSDILSLQLAQHRRIAKRKNIELAFNCNTVNTVIKADSYTVNQIFEQLIDNAIKYTEEGEIIIEVSRNEKDQLLVEIKDTGVGILEEYLPHLFEPFSQEEMGYTRKFDGNGIGMALVKKYCELNNAKIGVESEKGVGSTFRVKFC
ncbi:MAG: PAS domain-containing sensor histidine kinase, partial [Melioribacteraceae bacterium]|nr:PAS domain-containing sensor histidine kinase [Melioribacteraceae bacterium]